MTQLFDANIDIHGLILDQFDKPVSGAVVEYSIMMRQDLGRVWTESLDKHIIISDENGKFHLKSKGGPVYMSVSHPDCTRTRESSFSFANTPFDNSKKPVANPPEKPVVFRLQRVGEKQPMYKFRLSGWNELSVDQPHFINFKTGKLEPEQTDHSLKITPIGEIFGEAKRVHSGVEYRYGYTLEMMNEGIGGVYSKKEYLNMIAPNEGYQRLIVQGLRLDNPKKQQQLSHHFFVRFHDDTYGMLSVEMYKKQIIFQLSYGPTGSRNMVFDERLRIIPESRRPKF